MRVVPCVMFLAFVCVATAGCSLFRGQTSGDGKRWWFNTAQNQPKKSTQTIRHLARPTRTNRTCTRTMLGSMSFRLYPEWSR